MMRKTTNVLRGAAHRNAKLTEIQVAAIIQDVANGKKHSTVARSNNITRANVSLIVAGRTWKHLQRPAPTTQTTTTSEVN